VYKKLCWGYVSHFFLSLLKKWDMYFRSLWFYCVIVWLAGTTLVCWKHTEILSWTMYMEGW
jgi:hypothetical protein